MMYPVWTRTPRRSWRTWLQRGTRGRLYVSDQGEDERRKMDEVRTHINQQVKLKLSNKLTAAFQPQGII